jgi:hypothetical protein
MNNMSCEQCTVALGILVKFGWQLAAQIDLLKELRDEFRD